MAIYLFAGTDDPINNKTRCWSWNDAQKAGLKVQLKLCLKGSQKLNELNRDEVMDDLLAWLTESANVDIASHIHRALAGCPVLCRDLQRLHQCPDTLSNVYA